MNYLVTVAYDGSGFHGWAKQNNVRTVQNEIETLIERIFHQQITIHGSGRTDAYVHANAQTFSFRVKKNTIPPLALLRALKNISPDDLRFKSVKKVDDFFNARFDAKSKTYIYMIDTNLFNVLRSRYVLFYGHKVDVSLFKKISKYFIGEHDFKSFSTSELANTIRKVNYIKINKNKQIVKITINGNGFLRSMVRMIVGNMLAINEKKKTINDIENLLNNPIKGSSIEKAKACGLYLDKVNY